MTVEAIVIDAAGRVRRQSDLPAVTDRIVFYQGRAQPLSVAGVVIGLTDPMVVDDTVPKRVRRYSETDEANTPPPPPPPPIDYTTGSLIANGADFGGAGWYGSNVTIVADNGVAPDGTTTADLFHPNVAGTVLNYWQIPTSTLPSGPCIWSIFVKPSGKSIFWLDAYHDGAIHNTWFNLAGAGTILTNAAGNTTTIQTAPNGYYKCSITRTTAGATGLFDFGLADSDGIISITKNGTDGILSWGARVGA